MEMPATISVVANTLRVTASLGVLVAGGDVAMLLWIHTLSSLVNVTLLIWMLFVITRPRFSLDWVFWGRMLREAYPLALANLFSVIYFKVDTIMLASMRGSDAVGLYNAAYRLLEFTLIVPAYYTGAIFPVVSASHLTNPQRFLLIYRRSVKYMWVASLPLALGVSALAPKMIEVLYGKNYMASIPVLRVLMWTLLLIAVNAINAPYLIAMSRQKIVTFLTLAGMVFNIGLNFIAIPRYGILGAAWITLLSEVVTVAMFLAVLKKPLALNLRMFRHLIRPALAGVIMYGALFLATNWELGYQIILGGVVYCAMLWIGRAFDEVDGELFGRVLRPTETSTTRLT
jgi:O-antigen/teichoic acid export membrane protein